MLGVLVESIINSTLRHDKEPWYINAILKFGVPMSAFIGITIWALWRVDGNIIDIGKNVSTHLNDTSFTIKQMDELKILLRQQNSLMQQICVNTSKQNNTSPCFK